MSRAVRRLLALAAACLLHVAAASAEDPLADFGVIVPDTQATAPGFSLEQLDGGSVSLADYRGKVVAVNFWATWCAPCLEEMPSLQTLWEAYREQGFVLLAVATGGDTEKTVTRFRDRMDLGFPLLIDRDDDVRNQYRVVGLPVTYFVDRDGNIAGRVVSGRDWSSAQAAAVVERLLAR